jgi:hypothetical protein
MHEDVFQLHCIALHRIASDALGRGLRVLMCVFKPVWGDSDWCHQYRILSKYRRTAPHLHIKTVTGWGHGQLCNAIHKVRCLSGSDFFVFPLSGDLCSLLEFTERSCWCVRAHRQLNLHTFPDMWRVPAEPIPSTEMALNPRTNAVTHLPPPQMPSGGSAPRPDAKKSD